ncbi:WD domain-containing protein [Angomonas deanei]|nr:WD domain-containing protein [Angomonas deanei]|eukprot:EPY26749.1 WD domain-containing protein [Angomonas deanei]
MRLRCFLLRYYPPGITLEYETSSGQVGQKTIDLLTLTPTTNLDRLATEIIQAEPLLTDKYRDHVLQYLGRLVEKIIAGNNPKQTFYLFKSLRAHMLPLTNCAFNKSGDKFVTGSYDRTCKVWETASGNELVSLEGHRNVVYSVAFNNPFGTLVATGSFDKTCRIWDATDGRCHHTLVGHMTEIVCLSYNPQSTLIATGSMDNTAKVWDVETGQELHTLYGHCAEIVSLNFNTPGGLIVTGSFDHTAKLWDIRTGKPIHTLQAHRGEISSTQFNFASNMVVTGSIDRSCKLWDGGRADSAWRPSADTPMRCSTSRLASLVI